MFSPGPETGPVLHVRNPARATPNGSVPEAFRAPPSAAIHWRFGAGANLGAGGEAKDFQNRFDGMAHILQRATVHRCRAKPQADFVEDGRVIGGLCVFLTVEIQTNPSASAAQPLPVAGGQPAVAPGGIIDFKTISAAGDVAPCVTDQFNRNRGGSRICRRPRYRGNALTGFRC